MEMLIDAFHSDSGGVLQALFNGLAAFELSMASQVVRASLPSRFAVSGSCCLGGVL